MVRAIRPGAGRGGRQTGASGENPRGQPLAGILTITLPLTLPGIIVGTVLAFARSLGGVWRDHHVRLQYSR